MKDVQATVEALIPEMRTFSTLEHEINADPDTQEWLQYSINLTQPVF
jgi:hypothetical protein